MSIQDPTTDHANYLIVQPNRFEIGKFMSRVKIDHETGCWEWQGNLSKGYGFFYFNKRTEASHRWTYAWIYGPIPRRKANDIPQVDHLCRNRKCCNPTHLELVSPIENILRGESLQAKNARKTHCPRGHDYSVNGILSKKGYRICDICAREYRAKWLKDNTDKMKELRRAWKQRARAKARQTLAQ